MSFNYSVLLNDPANVGGAVDSILVYDLQQALGVWSQYISGIGTLVVKLDIANTTLGRETGAPTAPVLVGTNSQGLSIYEPSSFYELTTGQHVGGTTSDITITIDPGYFHYLYLAAGLTYNSQVPSNQYNPIVVFLHELGHGFGINGYYSQTGSLPGNVETTFDAFIQKTSSGAFFTGPNAEAAYGGPVPLTTDGTSGGNYNHLGNTQSDYFRTPSTVQDPLTLDLMGGIVLFFNYQYPISSLDLAILKDLGYVLETPPMVTAANVTSAHGQSFAASSLFTVSDAEHDPITKYQFYDSTTDAVSGHWVVSGAAQGANQVIEVTAAQLTQTSFQSGSGADNLAVRAFDGSNWSAWKNFTITAPVNRAPVVAAADTQLVKGNANPLLSSIVSASDADGDAFTLWQVADGTLGNGHLVVGGLTQGEQQTLTLTPAQFAGARFQSTTGSDELYARAFDGIEYSAWKVFHISAPVNHAPVVAASDTQLAKGNANPLLSSIVSASDADGETITQWQIADGTLGNGHLVVGGITQGEQQILSLTPAQFAGARFQSTTGTDELYARAFDGVDYGPWKVFHITAPVNHAPVVAASDTQLAKGNANPLLSSIVSASDADGEMITQWQVADGTLGNGHLVVGGMAQSEQQILTLTPAQFAGATFQSTTGTDELYARAFDGIDYGPWKVFHITAPVNHAPVVAAADTQLAKGNANPLISSIVSASDADGEAITQWQIADGTLGNGHLLVGGITQGEQQILTLTSAQFAGARFQSTTGTDELYARAFDGIEYGAWKVFHITAPVNHAPIVAAADKQLTKANANPLLSTLVSASDADGEAITQWQIADGTLGNGHLVVGGVTQGEQQILTLTPAQFAGATFQSTAGTDDLYARAFDGIDYGAWKMFHVTAPADAPPVVAGGNASLAVNTTIAAANLFSFSDPDNDTIKAYQFYDGTADPTSGHFVIDGAPQAALQILSAALDHAAFVTGIVSGVDQIYARAFDGLLWSDWHPLNITSHA